MFKLHQVSEDSFRIISPTAGVDSEGTLDEMRVLAERLGASPEEIGIGLREMSMNKHNTADFGVNLDTGASNFIYTANYSVVQKTRHEVEFVKLSDNFSLKVA